MKAVYINSFQGIKGIQIGDLPKPQPLPKEVLIEVLAAGINPVDWKITEGIFKERMSHHFPLIIGWDVSGIVAKVGSEVSNLKVGDEVYAYCRKPIIQAGTFAEYVCFDAEHVVHKPTNLNFIEAASIPLVALTAWQALVNVAKLGGGQSVLIHAGAGGVGSFAIQLAKYLGAHVSTTARKHNHEYVQKLGADIAIDYTKEDFVERMKVLAPEGVDLVLDCVGGETLARSYGCVKAGGWIVSIVAKPDEILSKEHDLHGGYVFVRPNGEELTQLKTLIESGKIVVSEIKEMSFDSVIQALEEVKTEHTRGKIVLKVHS